MVSMPIMKMLNSKLHPNRSWSKWQTINSNLKLGSFEQSFTDDVKVIFHVMLSESCIPSGTMFCPTHTLNFKTHQFAPVWRLSSINSPAGTLYPIILSLRKHTCTHTRTHTRTLTFLSKIAKNTQTVHKIRAMNEQGIKWLNVTGKMHSVCAVNFRNLSPQPFLYSNNSSSDPSGYRQKHLRHTILF